MEKFPCQFYVNGHKRARHWLLHRPVVGEVVTFDKMLMKVKSCNLNVDVGEYHVDLQYEIEPPAVSNDSGFQRSGWNDASPTKTNQPGKHPGGKRN